MKKILDFCSRHGLKFARINYNFNGYAIKRNGIDIVRPDNMIVASLEPIDDSYGNKWLVRHVGSSYSGPKYLKRITNEFLDKLNIQENTGFQYKGSRV